MATILLMEDDLFLAHVWESNLTMVGHKVVVKTNAKVALDYLLTHPIDVLITDMYVREGPNLSTEGGTTLLGRLQYWRLARNPSPAWMPKLRILAVSGAGVIPGGFDVLRHARELGAHAVLRKPILVEALLAAVDELLHAYDSSDAHPQDEEDSDLST